MACDSSPLHQAQGQAHGPQGGHGQQQEGQILLLFLPGNTKENLPSWSIYSTERIDL